MFSRFSRSVFTVLSLFLFLSSAVLAGPPANFSRAKVVLKEQIYFDQNQNGALGTIYCGCDWEWVGRSGGRVDPKGCGYQIRAIPNRGVRTEIEHVVPASWLGQQRQCWQNGGRKNCNKTDPVFNLMEADLHNMTVSVGELNADRSNYRFGVLPGAPKQHGLCESKVDFKMRVFEPRDEAKGIAARINFYMHDRYNLKMSKQQQRLFIVWDNQFPVTQWELERDRRISNVMGHSNEFVTGERTWRVGHRNSGEGVTAQVGSRAVNASVEQLQRTANSDSITTSESDMNGAPIHGNRNSKIYHPKGCPSYNAMSPRNVVNFNSEAEAQKAGYRRAKNCK